MEIKIKDSKLRKLLKKKQDIILTLREKGKAAIKMNTELEVLSGKRNNYVAQIHDAVDKIDLKLKEFEAVESVELRGGDVIIKTFDVIEKFKIKFLKDKNDESKANSDSTEEPSKKT